MGNACTARNTPYTFTEIESIKQKTSQFFQSTVAFANEDVNKINAANKDNQKLFAKITQVGGNSQFVFEITQSPKKIETAITPSANTQNNYPLSIDKEIPVSPKPKFTKKSSLSDTDLPKITLPEKENNVLPKQSPTKVKESLRVEPSKKEELLLRTITPSFGKIIDAEPNKISNASITSFRNMHTFMPGNDLPSFPTQSPPDLKKNDNSGLCSVIDLQGPIIAFNLANTKNVETPAVKTQETCQSENDVNHTSLLVSKGTGEESKNKTSTCKSDIIIGSSHDKLVQHDSQNIKDTDKRKKIRVTPKSKFKNNKILLPRDSDLIASETISEMSRNESLFFQIHRNQSECKSASNRLEKKGSLELGQNSRHSAKEENLCKTSEPIPSIDVSLFAKAEAKINSLKNNSDDVFSPPFIELEGLSLQKNRSVMADHTDGFLDGSDLSLVYISYIETLRLQW